MSRQIVGVFDSVTPDCGPRGFQTGVNALEKLLAGCMLVCCRYSSNQPLQIKRIISRPQISVMPHTVISGLQTCSVARTAALGRSMAMA